MRLISWNCNMAAHLKVQELLKLLPDVAILSECAAPEVRAAEPLYRAASSYAWTGTHRTKGIAILCFGQYTLEPVQAAFPTGLHAMPVRVRGAVAFNLLGFWAQGTGLRGYVESANAALSDYEAFLRESPAVVAGDFNSNATWDRRTQGGHSRLVERLDALGLVSAYHAQYGEAPGAESRPTFFQRRRRAEPFHIDYVFVPRSWALAGHVEVGDPEHWLSLSDHMPVVFSNPALPQPKG